jgi:hypothetical protein
MSDANRPADGKLSSARRFFHAESVLLHAVRSSRPLASRFSRTICALHDMTSLLSFNLEEPSRHRRSGVANSSAV